MQLTELKILAEDIKQACQQYGAKNIRVFGSVATGNSQLDSDIDFLVEFPKGYSMFSQRLPLQERLAELTGRPIDLIPEHELNPHIRMQVLAEAVSL